MGYFEFIVISMLLLVLVYKDIRNERRMDRMMEAFFAKNLGELKYYQDKWPEDRKEQLKRYADVRKQSTAKPSTENDSGYKVDIEAMKLDDFEDADSWREEDAVVV